jgi:hypothetical protein
LAASIAAQMSNGAAVRRTWLDFIEALPFCFQSTLRCFRVLTVDRPLRAR